MQEDAQQDITIISVAKIQTWIVTVTQLFTDNEICAENRLKLYPDHYNKNLLMPIHHLLGTTRCSVQFWEQGKLSSTEDHGTIEGENVPFYKWIAKLHSSALYTIQSPVYHSKK